jgi:hypothetical protein
MNFSLATRGRCGGDRMTVGFTTIYAIGKLVHQTTKQIMRRVSVVTGLCGDYGV